MKRLLLCLPALLIPSVAFASTTENFYPYTSTDVHIESAAYSTWDAAHDAASGTVNGDPVLRVYATHDNSGTPYYISRGFMNFDTSGLPDNATVTAVTLRLTPKVKYDTSNIDVVLNSTASNTTVVGGDFDQVGDTGYGSYLYASAVVDSAYTLALDSSIYELINKTGYTKLGLREHQDLTDTEPPLGNPGTYYADGIVFYNQNETGTDKDPYLSVTYTVPVCGNSLVEAGEACDDGGTTPGDGCSATCTVESGYSCTGEPSVCSEVCGDGIVTVSEECDDGDTSAGDGCSATCTVEEGWTCDAGEPSICTENPASSSSSSAHSYAPPEPGAYNLDSSGSLIMASAYCGAYEPSGSGSICSQWDFSMQIPFAEFAVHSGAVVATSAVVLGLALYVVFSLLLSVCRFFFRLFTQRFP